jgi:hypothetical protein
VAGYNAPEKAHPAKYAEALQEVKRKKIKSMGLDKHVGRSGFLKFKDYQSKLKMMDTPLFLFGMKMQKQFGNIEFFDADFSNTILVSSMGFIDKTLRECCDMINASLKKSGFVSDELLVGQLKGVNDFDLSGIQVREEEYKISVRLNSFSEAKTVFHHLHNSTG